MNLPSVNQIPEAARADFEDCTVTAVSPLRIKRDADAVELAFTPDTLVNTAFLTIGDRVRVDISRNPMLIIGRADGLILTAESVTAVANTLARRDAAGNAQGGTPVVPADWANKGYVDTASGIVIPASIAVGSGSASVDANGLITFTGASRVSLNGVFAGTVGEVYKVFVTSKGTANAYQYLRSRNAGVDVASAGYNRVATYTYSTSGPTRSGQFGDTVLTYLYPGGAAVPDISAEMTWHTPNVTGRVCQVHTVALSAASDRYLWEEYGQGNKADGLSLIAASGTMTGTIKVVRIA